jgi:hypothetical protein
VLAEYLSDATLEQFEVLINGLFRAFFFLIGVTPTTFTVAIVVWLFLGMQGSRLSSNFVLR